MGDQKVNMELIEIAKIDDSLEITATQTRSREKKSDVWAAFTKITVGGIQKARCNACKSLFATSNTLGTSHLRRHHFFTCPFRTSTAKRQPTSSAVSGKRSREPKSEVWTKFTRVLVGGIEKARCNACKSLLSGSGNIGTSHLRRHCFFTCPLRTVNGKLQQRRLSFSTALDAETDSITDWHFDLETSRRELARMIIVHELPFSLVDFDGFRRFTRSLNPGFGMYGQDAIRNDCFDIYEKEKSSIKESLKSCCERLSLTTDIWMSNQDMQYLLLAAYFIDNNWILQKKVLRFCLLEDPCSAFDLANMLFNALSEWNLDHKVISITVDNASMTDAFIPILKDSLVEKGPLCFEGKVFHVTCAASVLNLIVKDAFHAIGDIIKNVRDIIKYLSASPSHQQKFREVVEQVGLSYDKPLCLDVFTHWDSTYLMLETALEYKEAFSVLVLMDSGFKCAPSMEEWNTLDIVCKILKTLYNATNTICGTKQLTANLCFHEIWKIKMQLDEELSNPHTSIVTMINEMQAKFGQYWDGNNLFLTISVILDPRFKLKFIEFCFQMSYGNRAHVHILKLEQAIQQLFLEYEAMLPPREEATTSKAWGTSVKSGSGGFDILKGWNQFLSQQANSHTRKELDKYLQESVHSAQEDFDILKWWSVNKTLYPTLSRMAHDILTIPASTVAPNLAFSTGAKVLSDFRSSLDSDTVEALVCAQDWIQNAPEGLTEVMPTISEMDSPAELSN